MPPSDWRHGKTIGPLWEGGPVGLRYLSPSGITLGDDRHDGCPRKWWHEKVAGKKPPETKSQALGTALHAELERYVLTGQRDLSQLALAGLHAVPVPPWDDVGVEVEMGSGFSDPESAFAVREAAALREAGDLLGAERMLAGIQVLSAAGVPVLGRIDLVHARCTNQGAEGMADAYDPPNTVEVLDYKTTSDLERYAKTAAELGHTPQMLSYGNWVLIAQPTVERVRLSHLYFQTRGAKKTRKVTTIIEREVLRERWANVEAVAAELAAVARAPDQDQVRANQSACEAYGGCPHRTFCTAGTKRRLKALQRKPSPAIRPAQPVPTVPTGAIVPMSSFLDSIRKKNAEKAGGGAAAAPTLDPKFAEAYKALEDANAAAKELGLEAYGFPLLKGDAAKQRCLMVGHPPNGAALSGTVGLVGSIEVNTIAEFLELSSNVVGDITEKVNAADAPDGASAPDAAEPVGAAEVAAAASTAASTKVSPLPPDAAQPDPATASAGPGGKDPNKKGGRGAKKAAADAPATPPGATTAAAIAQKSEAPTPTRADVYVRTIPPSGTVTVLGPWMRELWRKFADETGCDPRIHPDKPLAFGGWRAIWEERVRFALAELTPGTYTYFPVGEVEEAALPALAAGTVGLVVGGAA